MAKTNTATKLETTTTVTHVDTTSEMATDALIEGRVMDALLILTESMSLNKAIAHLVMPAPAVGDILVSSWGYDQTNIDFYQVVGVTAKSVKIRAIGKTCTERREYTDMMVPDVGAFKGEPMTKRFTINRDEASYSCRIESFASACLYNGEPRSQTGAMYGH